MIWATQSYVERNPRRANLVKRAEQWRWSSLWRRKQTNEEAKALVCDGPLPLPDDWCHHVNQAQTNREVEAVQRSVVRGTPFGSEAWIQKTARRLDLEYTLRPRGRPKKAVPK
jgi:putative transposase